MLRSGLYAGLILAFTATAHAAPPTQFDIACKYQSTAIATGSEADANAATMSPYYQGIRFHIDTTANKACTGANKCDDMRDIKVAPNGNVVLQAFVTGAAMNTIAKFIVFDPSADTLTIKEMQPYQGRRVDTTQTYSCKREAFTPFPAS